MSSLFTISIVVFKSDIKLLENTIKSLIDSCIFAKIDDYKIFIINNDENKIYLNAFKNLNNITYIQGHGNIGYGRGHNLVIHNIGKFHLILNPDVLVDKLAVLNCLNALKDKNLGMITPSTFDENSNRQHIIKSYPNILIFLLRVLNISFINKIFKKQIDKYENKSINYKKENKDIIFTSGCFMFYKSSIFKKLNGFNEKFFLYFEDMDLSYRTSKISNIIYKPDVIITHYGGNASRKGFKHWVYFISSMINFFNIYGWKFY